MWRLRHREKPYELREQGEASIDHTMPRLADNQKGSEKYVSSHRNGIPEAINL